MSKELHIVAALALSQALACTTLQVERGDRPSYWRSPWPNCPKKVVCVVSDVRPMSQTIDIVVVNTSNFPITLDLEFTEAEYVAGLPKGIRTLAVPRASVQRMYHLPLEDLSQWRLKYQWAWNVGLATSQHNDNIIYGLPFKGASRVSQSYDGEFSHQGPQFYSIDFDLDNGSMVTAARAGIVVAYRASSNQGGPATSPSFGNFIRVLHDDGTYANYYHLKKDGIMVALGDNVVRGQIIGISGNTGYTNGPHLHFEVMKTISGKQATTVPIVFETSAGKVRRPVVGRIYSERPLILSH